MTVLKSYWHNFTQNTCFLCLVFLIDPMIFKNNNIVFFFNFMEKLWPRMEDMLKYRKH